MGKGSGRRPMDISREQYEANYERIFGKKERKRWAPPPLETKYGPTYDELAAAFHDETGMFAPGADAPAAIGSPAPPEERRAAWQAWLRGRKTN